MKVTASIFNYRKEHFSVTRSDCVKDLGVLLENCIFFVFLRVIVSRLAIWSVYMALVRSKLKYVSLLSNNLTFTGSGKLENIHRK